MKSIFNLLLITALLSTTLISCEEDEAKEMDIHFKTENGYIHTDQTLDGGTEVLIGIEASTKKSKDPLVRFNISEAVDGGDPVSVYTESISTTSYDYDYAFTLGNEAGSVHEYTFTVTNRDGFNRQTSLTITVQ